MVSLKPIAYGKLFHLLRIISTIEGKKLTFNAPYDYHSMREPESSIDINRGEWSLITGDSPVAYWQRKESKLRKPIHSSTNWLSYGIDELLSYPPSSLTRAIHQWKIQYKKNQACRRSYAKGIPSDANKPLDLCQKIYDLTQEAVELEIKINQSNLKSPPSRNQFKRRQRRLEELWDRRGTLLFDHRKQLPSFDDFTGSEADCSPIIACLALPGYKEPPSSGHTKTTIPHDRHISQSNTYFIVQNTLLRHIRLATRFRQWLRKIPAPARRFANKQDHSGFRWFLINLWIYTPRSRSLLENDQYLTYLIASTWNVSESQVLQPFARLDQIISGKRRSLLCELGLPPTRAMLRMIRQGKSIPKQHLKRGKGGITIYISAHNRLKITLDQLLPIWPWAWSWIAPYDLQKAYTGADLLLQFTKAFPSNPSPPTIHLFKAIMDPNYHEKKPPETIPLDWICIRILDLLKSDEIPQNLLSDSGRLLYFTRLTRCKSLKKLIKFYQKLESLLTKARDQKRFSSPKWKARLATFPKHSPLENIPPSWTELKNIKQVYLEGQRMNHCLYEQHLEDIADNRMFAYSIHGPKNEKATLTIRKQSNRWQFDQLVGSGNTEPSIDLSLPVLRVLPNLLREYQQTHCPLSKGDQNQIDKFHNDPLISDALKTFEQTLR